MERRAVYDTAMSLGARKVYLIAEPVAASLGAGLPIGEPGGAMVVDIGGGTSDIAVLSSGVIVSARTLRCAGNAMDEAIIRYVRRQHQLLIGEANAERIKIEAGTALADGQRPRRRGAHPRPRSAPGQRQERGADAPRTSPRRSPSRSRPSPTSSQRALEDLPPDVLSDITRRGIHLTGGGALLDKLDVALTRRVGVKFHVQQNPMHCVVKGSAAVLAGLDRARASADAALARLASD